DVDDRVRLDAERAPHRTPGELRAEVPERAVERIARTAGRQQGIDEHLVERLGGAALDRSAARLELFAHGRGCLAEVVDAERLAAAACARLLERDRHRNDLGRGETGDD